MVVKSKPLCRCEAGAVASLQEGLRNYQCSGLQIIVMTTAVEITLDIELEDKHRFYDSLLHAHYMLGDGKDEPNRGELLSLAYHPREKVRSNQQITIKGIC